MQTLLPLRLPSPVAAALPSAAAFLLPALTRVSLRGTPSRASMSAAASAPDGAGATARGFPSFLPRAVERIRDGAAIRLAKRIERVPVQASQFLQILLLP